MPLLASERAALLAHSQRIDESERKESAEWERLFALNAKSMLGQAAIGSTIAKDNVDVETLSSVEIHHRVAAQMAVFIAKNRPAIDPWDTPAKLLKSITEDEETWGVKWELARSFWGMRPLTDNERWDRAAELGPAAVNRAYARLMNLAVVAPSVRTDFPPASMTNFTIALSAIKAWCTDAAKNLIPDALSTNEGECLEALFALGVTEDPQSRRATGAIVKKANPASDEGTYKGPLAELVRRGLLRSKGGRSGGYWFTAGGFAVAQKL